MSASDKNIPVRFITRQPSLALDNKMPCSTLLGYASQRDIDHILAAVARYTPTPDSCILHMYIDYINRTHAGSASATTWHKSFVEISNVYWNVLRCINHPASDTTRAQQCAIKLGTGECSDKFMRETFGMTLFPHCYAKKTQK